MSMETIIERRRWERRNGVIGQTSMLYDDDDCMAAYGCLGTHASKQASNVYLLTQFGIWAAIQLMWTCGLDAPMTLNEYWVHFQKCHVTQPSQQK